MNAERVASWLARSGAIREDAVSVAALTPFLMERQRALACADCDAYLALLERSAEERSRVVAACAPSETWLFRYPASFELLRRMYRGRSSGCRMLSAGSGGLAEPASIVATLVSAGLAPSCIAVDAIDQSVEAAQALNAFSGTLVREPIPSWAAVSFVPLPTPMQGVALDRALASRISLEAGDLRSCPLQGHYDAIFFRNVAIYLSDAMRLAILARLRSVLAHDGVLFVGHAEMRVAEQAGFAPIAEVGAFALRARVASVTKPWIALSPASSVEAPVASAPIAVATPIAASQTPLEQARAAVAQDPSCASLHEALAALELTAGDAAAAEGSLRRALYLEQRRESALLSLALLLEQQGRSMESERFRARAWRAHLASEAEAR